MRRASAREAVRTLQRCSVTARILCRNQPMYGVYSTPSRFPEPCGHVGLQPSPKHVLEASDIFHVEFSSVFGPAGRTCRVSELRIDGDRDDDREP
jgi:hypothetical protein